MAGLGRRTSGQIVALTSSPVARPPAAGAHRQKRRDKISLWGARSMDPEDLDGDRSSSILTTLTEISSL